MKSNLIGYIKRKSLLYKTAVEYGDYTINHVQGCSHGCIYPCYAMLMARRFGKVATYKERIEHLYELHKRGIKTWVSIEPYPTPNIIQQDFDDILDAISFVDKIIFGKMNYNAMVSKYAGYKEYFNLLSEKVIDFCRKYNKEYHIKEGTITK